MSADRGSSFWNLFTQDDPSSPPPPPASFWNLFTDPDETPEGETAPGQGPGTTRAPQSTPAALAFNPELIFWALRNLPVEEAVKHLAVIGAVGSGKTTLIQLYLQSLAPRFRADWSTPEQLIIFDGKCDVIPLLDGLGLRPEDENVHILNPYDERGVGWSVAEGAQGPLMARHLATLLVPEEPHSQSRYFSDAARDLVYAVILALNHVQGTRWTLRDLICALDTPQRIRAITNRDPRAGVIAGRILDDDKHAFAVLSTLGTKLVRFEPVAALWHSSRQERQFSIEEFFQQPGVLVLANDPVLHDSIWPINALLLKALTQEILRRGETRSPRHWFVLDEFPAMERVDCIHDLLRRGRSKGAAVLLGLQSLESLMSIYGQHEAEDILSQCSTKTFLRAGGPGTAEWAERYFGKQRHIEETWSESWSRADHSVSVQRQLTDRTLFLSSVFLNLPLPRPGGPMIAVSDVPCLRSALYSRRWFDQVLGMLKAPTQVPNVQPRTSLKEQVLAQWDPAEEKLFCGEAPAVAGQDQAKSPTELPDPKRRHGSGRKRSRSGKSASTRNPTSR